MTVTRYPENWKELALVVKEAANWQCQKCGLFCIKPGEPLSDAIKLRCRVYTLQVHHWNHNPADNRLENSD